MLPYSTKGSKDKTFVVFTGFPLSHKYFSANFKIFRCLEIFSTSFCAILMQTKKFFRKYSHGDLTTKVLSLETFILYGITCNVKRLSKTSDSCKFLNLLLKGCNAPCVQSTIATRSTPLGRLILLYCAC